MAESYTYLENGVVAPAGFTAAGVAAGIKPSGRKDVAIIAADRPVPAAGVFTQNAMAAPPVYVSKAALSTGSVRAIVVNAGNANACTGEQGTVDAHAMASATADALDCDAGDVVVASTGVIGVPLPMGAVVQGIDAAATALDNANGDAPAEAILTTDTFVKQIALSLDVDGRTYTVGGIAKGSGMIEPNMATMLAFITTDAPLTSAACTEALAVSTDLSFNRITVDGDTSTNDMCVLMASGAAAPGEEITPDASAYEPISRAITHVAQELAKMIVRDGEGATKLVEVTVTGAENEADAHAAALEIADSPLVKTALFGNDPNWGRIVMALGNSGARIDPARVDVTIAGVATCRSGQAVEFDHEAAVESLSAKEVSLRVDLQLADASATVWTCDFSYDYVRINAEYTT